MKSKSDQSRDFYFKIDIGMAAMALTEMFGDDVKARVIEAQSN